MLIQKEQVFVPVIKKTPGHNAYMSDKITVSKHKSGRKEVNSVSLSISVPDAIITSAGMEKGNYVKIAYSNDICKLERTNCPSEGYKLSRSDQVRSNGKIRVTLALSDAMERSFFVNGENGYDSTTFEVKPNLIQFTIGEYNKSIS